MSERFTIGDGIRLGFGFYAGVLGLLILSALAGWALGGPQPWARDDTDPPGYRSGLKLYTDHKTGCQYFKGGPFGSITPRLDREGKPVCAGGQP